MIEWLLVQIKTKLFKCLFASLIGQKSRVEKIYMLEKIMRISFHGFWYLLNLCMCNISYFCLQLEHTSLDGLSLGDEPFEYCRQQEMA